MSFLGLFSTPEEKAARQASKEYKQQQKAERQQQREASDNPYYLPPPDPKKEAKKREWADANEQVKYVIHGGKVQCKYASPPTADFVVIDPGRVSLQDKLMATTQDTNGQVNFNFTGVCKHPSQQKPSAPPPPCKAVINLGQWEDYSETKINDDHALLVKSTIKCNVSGEAIKVIDSGQKAELTDVKPYDLTGKKFIIDAYWVDEESGEEFREIRSGVEVPLHIITRGYKPGETVTIEIVAEEGRKFDDGSTEISVSETVDENGVAVVEKLKITYL